MKKLAFVFALLAQVFPFAGQLEPNFQTTLYFEDAAGNRDTIVVGLDTLADAFYNPQFGEMDISAPFDSVFEVRATHWSSFGWGEGNYVLSKKIVSVAEHNVDPPACLTGAGVLLFMHARYQPVRIYWQPGTFDTYCLHGSFFTPDRLHQMIDPWDWLAMPAIRFGCAAGVDSYEIGLGDAFRAPQEIPYIAMQEVEGQPGVQDSIYGLAFGITESYFIPCSQVPVHNVASAGTMQSLDIYPNPADDYITLGASGDLLPAAVYLYDGTGTGITALSSVRGALQIDTRRLRRGVYFVVLRSDSGMVRTGKFIKM